MKLSSNQKGFAVIETILIIVIIAIIGGAGYYVYTANKKTNDALSAASKVAQSSPDRTTKKKITTDATSSQNYLTIKEWNVKIKLSSSSTGAYYKVSDTDTATPPIFLNVFSTKADSIAGPTGKTCQGEYIGLLMRLPKDDPRWDDPQYVGASIAQKDIGSYRYNIATHKQYGPECFETTASGDYVADPVTSTKFDQIVKSFTTDFKTIQAQ